MLKSLQLKNVALIERAEIEFEKGLNVLSGETGSGKSVVIDSINFVLGAKADKTMIRHGENDCLVIAVFDVENLTGVKNLLTDSGFDDSDEIIVSRKLTADGKSSIRLNGEPVTLGMLRTITGNLIDVHGQSDHYSLLKDSEQLAVVDNFSGDNLKILKNQCLDICKDLREIDEKMLSFGGSESERAIRADILKYQIEEIKNADPKEGEEDELLAKRKKIQSAEKIAEAFGETKNAIDGENCISDLLGSALRRLGQVASLDDEYSSIFDRLKSVSEELTDISSVSEDILDGLEFNEEDADKIENRLDVIKNLKRKYGNTEKEIEEFLQNAENEYDKLCNFDAEYAELTSLKQKKIAVLNDIYSKISDERKNQAKKLSSKVTGELRQLGMKDAEFKIDFEPLKEISDAPYSGNGGDRVEFMFSANLGEPVKPMSKIISGGEMSRLMLALKTVISSYHEISTYIFDEIDAGISGKTAETVAEKFADISKGVQIIAISHLPQIVSFSDYSYKIAKYTENGKTYTGITKLDDSEKVEEVVRLIGGDLTSKSAVEHATELIEKANEYKRKNER